MISDKFKNQNSFFMLQLVIQIFQFHGTYMNINLSRTQVRQKDRDHRSLGKVREKGDKPGTCSQ